jgi:hypothetical protein
VPFPLGAFVSFGSLVLLLFPVFFNFLWFIVGAAPRRLRLSSPVALSTIKEATKSERNRKRAAEMVMFWIRYCLLCATKVTSDFDYHKRKSKVYFSAVSVFYYENLLLNNEWLF